MVSRQIVIANITLGPEFWPRLKRKGGKFVGEGDASWALSGVVWLYPMLAPVSEDISF